MNTKLTNDDIQHLATISGLELTSAEADGLCDDLGAILGYFEQLKALDTTGVEPTFRVGAAKNVWRQDVAEPSSVSREQLLALAPQARQHQVEVPKVL